MCRKLFCLVSFVLVLGLVGNASAVDATHDWDGEARPDHNWTTANNWLCAAEPNTVPTLGDRVDLNYDPCDPNRYRLYPPLIEVGMDVTIGNVLDAFYLSMSDSYTPEDLNQPDGGPDPNACVVDINGGKLTLEGLLRIAHRGYGTINMSGGTLVVHGGGKFRLGNYAPRVTKTGPKARSFGTINMTGGEIDYTAGTIDCPSNYGSGHIQLDGGVIKCDNLDMDEQVEPNQTGTMDVNGGTLISNTDRAGKFTRYANSGWITAYGGLRHGSIDPNSGLRVIVSCTYDSGTDKTTISRTQVDPNTAHSPGPRDGGTAGLDPNQKVKLGWGPITGATLRDVYFGTTFNDVNDANTSDGEFQGNQAATNWYTPVLGLGVVRYWRIDEYVPTTANLLEDDFEGGTWDANWTNVNWTEDTVVYNSPTSSASIVGGGATATLTSGSLNASDACQIDVEFAYQTDDVDTGEVFLYYTSNGSTYNLITDLDVGTDDEWLDYSDTITDSNYFTSNFGIRFESTCDKSSETLWVDDVSVDKTTSYAVYKGNTWTFTTGDYLTVDNFDSYIDDATLRAVWSLGDTVAYYDAEGAMEVRHAYSVSEQKVGRVPPDADWTKEGVKSLSVEFKGEPNNSDMELFVVVNNVEVNYPPGSPYDMKIDEWQEFNIELADFTGVDMNNVTSVYIGLRGGAATNSLTYPDNFVVDNVRLYLPRCVPDTSRSVADIVGGECVVDNKDLDVLTEDWLISDYNIATSAPSSTGLVAQYTFNDGTANDSAPSPANGTLVGDATVVYDSARDSNVLELDGNGDYVNCSNDVKFDVNGPITVAAWVKVNVFNKDKQGIVTKGGSTWRLRRWSDTILFGHNGLTFDNTGGETSINDGEWHHIAGVYNSSNAYVYIDGALDNSQVVTGDIAMQPQMPVYIGENSDKDSTDPNLIVVTDVEFDGRIDEVRIYSRALSQAEIAYLADDMAKPDDVKNDGYKYVPVLSDAELYSGDPRDSRSVNFRDFAILAADNWLQAQTWP